MSRAAQLRVAQRTNEDFAADWLADMSDSKYAELVGEWFDKHNDLSDQFFAEMVVPAWERIHE